MALRVRVTPAAEADLDEIVAWYDAAGPGLGERFLRAVEDRFAFIAEWPDGSPRVHRHLRRIWLVRFPYGLLYERAEDEVVVLGCFHVRRDPAVWRSRSRPASEA